MNITDGVKRAGLSLLNKMVYAGSPAMYDEHLKELQSQEELAPIEAYFSKKTGTRGVLCG
jgi:hypothetical protein